MNLPRAGQWQHLSDKPLIHSGAVVREFDAVPSVGGPVLSSEDIDSSRLPGWWQNWPIAQPTHQSLNDDAQSLHGDSDNAAPQ